MGNKKMLFDDCDDTDDISKIQVDEAFARRYEHNNKREDLHKLQELKKKKGIFDESDESDSESDDDYDDDPELRGDNDAEFFERLRKVKEQDPELKQEGVQLFPDGDDSEDGASEEDENEAERDKKEKKKKPMHLKDVIAKNLIEYGAEYDEEGDERVRPQSYVDEQEALKRAFFNEAEKVDDDDGPLLKVKAGNNEDDGDNDQNDDTFKKPIAQYFGADDKLDENAMFLKSFFLNKLWIDKDKGMKVSEDDLAKVSDEEEEVDEQEDYEREYNFRHQENTGDRVLSYSRITEDSVRKKPNPRKVQRQNKADRMAIAKLEREEELKHLKNVKKEDFISKLNKVKDVAGISQECGFVFGKEDMEGEFDPEEHDRKMKQMFDEDYYNSTDAKPDFCSDDEEEDEDLVKPNFGVEDILLGLPEGCWDKELEGVDDEEDVDEEDVVDGKVEMAHEELAEGKRKRKQKHSLLEKVALDDVLDEEQKKELKEQLYKLDYEGTVGDLKTRFPYRKVKPKRFGLSGKEILLMDDGELNQYVSLKKIAPYVEEDYKVPSNKRYEVKMKNKLLLEGVKVREKVVKGKKSLKDEAQKSFSGKDGLEKEEENVQGEKSNGATDKVLSRHSKRRRQQQDLKLSNARKAAYGTVDAPQSSKKSKHRT